MIQTPAGRATSATGYIQLPVGMASKRRRNHKFEEFLRQFRWLLLYWRRHAPRLLPVAMAFAEVRGGVIVLLLFNNVIRRRGGVTGAPNRFHLRNKP